jgi:hypothetical protein
MFTIIYLKTNVFTIKQRSYFSFNPYFRVFRIAFYFNIFTAPYKGIF